MLEKIIKQNENRINMLWEKADNKLKKVAVSAREKLPYTTVDGKYNDFSKTRPFWWTNGFWPGLMWLMYADTKNEEYRITAENAEILLDKAFADYKMLNHDVGFMWHISSGVNYRLTGNDTSLQRTMRAADILAARYNCAGGFIRAWNGDDQAGWTIIDCMMNLPLLYWASEETGDNRYKQIAMNHADKAMHTHVRPDGSVNHIVSLEPQTGEVIDTLGGQGYGKGSTWSRGQAWAIYGYVLSYIHTGKAEYLEAAKKTAHYFIANVCDDWLPKCDFRSPEEPVIYDSTAGAIAACGLIEIAKAVGEHEQSLYINAALKLLWAMDDNFCDYSDESDAILKMGTERYHIKRNPHHINIIYGDYYFIEALYKLRGNTTLFW